MTAPEAHNADVPPGPLEQALSTREGDTLTMTRSGPSDAASMGQVPKQGSRALGLTGRLSSLFSRRSSMGDVSQHDDDFSGSSYMQREY